MNQDTKFIYTYSAKENVEIQAIRRKYLCCEENKIEELKRLDYIVSNSGIAESLFLGISGALIFGLGICFVLQILLSGTFFRILGVIICAMGIALMIAAYPVYRMVFKKTKEKYIYRILDISAELISDEM